LKALFRFLMVSKNTRKRNFSKEFRFRLYVGTCADFPAGGEMFERLWQESKEGEGKGEEHHRAKRKLSSEPLRNAGSVDKD